MSAEEWRPIPGWEDLYAISSHGRVKSFHFAKPRILRPGANPKGYLHVCLHRDRQQTIGRLHVLVAAAFLGSRPDGAVIRHLNGDQTDNRPENLAYGTVAENNRDMVAHGTHACAAKTHCKWGHEFTPENTKRNSTTGSRVCIACARRHSKAQDRSAYVAARSERRRIAREAKKQAAA